jgi:hypothetical protein
MHHAWTIRRTSDRRSRSGHISTQYFENVTAYDHANCVNTSSYGPHEGFSAFDRATDYARIIGGVVQASKNKWVVHWVKPA